MLCYTYILGGWERRGGWKVRCYDYILVFNSLGLFLKVSLVSSTFLYIFFLYNHGLQNLFVNLVGHGAMRLTSIYADWKSF